MNILQLFGSQYAFTGDYEVNFDLMKIKTVYLTDVVQQKYYFITLPLYYVFCICKVVLDNWKKNLIKVFCHGRKGISL